ncbi:phosphoacetylglucosamine mutase-like isoform X2 [Patiria miniata]|uniref:Phosphoacetylglucosamine mutase n=1 Tax=Patiria miniata TaxID=46514 RepID=A0A914B4B8_PATMI|nr:phosphoacetylglucosamine mutase-like isoform X2 [Patiria miniata]
MNNLPVHQAIAVGASKHPHKGKNVFSYGTAGIRCRADILDPVLYRLGLLVVLRSRAVRATIGVVITASHNPEQDNGAKVVEPMGEMLLQTWEGYATQIANTSDEDLGQCVQSLISELNIDMALPANIFLARDTRPSSFGLAQALIDGIQALKGDYIDYGLLSTPQLHYMVRCQNTQGGYGNPTEHGYYSKLASAFTKVREQSETDESEYTGELSVDGANGIGALKIQQMCQHLNNQLKISVYNDGTHGQLNDRCGADFVKVQQKPPHGMPTEEAGRKCVSLDGDADRIVYYFVDSDGVFHLLDGDKIATLIAGYIQELLTAANLQLNMGLVQTAYANGSSTQYATDVLKVPVACACTGVKHLHHRAQDFDVGVYFEANGHGTVLFSALATEKINSASQDERLSSDQRQAATTLKYLQDLINETVGDAISDMLVVECILHAKGWTMTDWNAAYTDLPNRQLKVKVKDRRVIQTTNAERCATTPAGLQEAIDGIVSKYNNARSFVRPSGTEDIVRIYAEADTQVAADSLAYEVATKVYHLADGVGDPPAQPSSS